MVMNCWIAKNAGTSFLGGKLSTYQGGFRNVSYCLNPESLQLQRK